MGSPQLCRPTRVLHIPPTFPLQGLPGLQIVRPPAPHALRVCKYGIISPLGCLGHDHVLPKRREELWWCVTLARGCARAHTHTHTHTHARTRARARARAHTHTLSHAHTHTIIRQPPPHALRVCKCGGMCVHYCVGIHVQLTCTTTWQSFTLDLAHPRRYITQSHTHTHSHAHKPRSRTHAH